MFQIVTVTPLRRESRGVHEKVCKGREAANRERSPHEKENGRKAPIHYRRGPGGVPGGRFRAGFDDADRDALGRLEGHAL
ncbi:hypothetical protein PT2222_70078 [Paraburkholderia tropica]